MNFTQWWWCYKKYITVMTSEDGMEKVIKFGEAILHLRLKYEFSVTSWGRTTKRNQFVSGVPGSNHLLWLAVDVILDDQKKDVEFEKDAGILGLMAIYEQDHYHIQPK